MAYYYTNIQPNVLNVIEVKVNEENFKLFNGENRTQSWDRKEMLSILSHSDSIMIRTTLNENQIFSRLQQ